jgi:hypothetical protein
MRAIRTINWLVLSDGVSSTQLGTAGQTTGAPRVLALAEARERFETPEATKEIAAWVNEGGAGGEVSR